MVRVPMKRNEPNRTETDFVPFHLPSETVSVSVWLRFTSCQTVFGGINRNRTEYETNEIFFALRAKLHVI